MESKARAEFTPRGIPPQQSTLAEEAIGHATGEFERILEGDAGGRNGATPNGMQRFADEVSMTSPRQGPASAESPKMD
jgi:hypothetical protein